MAKLLWILCGLGLAASLGAVLLTQGLAKVSLFAATVAKLCLSGGIERARLLCTTGKRDPWVSALAGLLTDISNAPSEKLARRRWLLTRMIEISRSVKVTRLFLLSWLVAGALLSAVAALCVLAPSSMALPRDTLLVLVCLGLFGLFQSVTAVMQYHAKGNKELLVTLLPALDSLPSPS